MDDVIRSKLNSSCLNVFLFGIYTGIYSYTISVYAFQDRYRRRRGTVIGCLTALLTLTAVGVFVDWYRTFMIFVALGRSTRAEIFFDSFENIGTPPWMNMLLLTSFIFRLIPAEGLMIWRCYHATGHSLKRCVLPVGLFIIQAFLAVSDIVLYCVFINGKPVVTKRSLKLFDSVDGVFNLISAATSLLATWTIARRIHLATRNEYIPRSRYQYIINICVGSSLCYSCAVVVTAIRDELSSAGVKVPLSYFAGNLYVSHLVTFLTGVAPTAMVARLTARSLEKTDISESNLSFELDEDAVRTSTVQNSAGSPEAC